MRNIIFGGIAALTFGMLVAAKPFEVVDTGHRGVQITLGKVVSESLPEGIYFYNPFISRIEEMDVRTQKAEANVQTYTKDIQQAAVSYTINYNLSSTNAHTVFETVGHDWDAVLVRQVVEGTLKGVTGRWDAVDLIANRDKARAEVEASISAALVEKNVIVTKFEITNIDYNDEFEKAVEAKVTAIQRASESQNKTVQITEEAKQRIIAAEAEAKSMRIRSEALSQNKALVEYEAVMKWDGKMPQYMLGNATPFINVSK